MIFCSSQETVKLVIKQFLSATLTVHKNRFTICRTKQPEVKGLDFTQCIYITCKKLKDSGDGFRLITDTIQVHPIYTYPSTGGLLGQPGKKAILINTVPDERKVRL